MVVSWIPAAPSSASTPLWPPSVYLAVTGEARIRVTNPLVCGVARVDSEREGYASTANFRYRDRLPLRPPR